MFNNNNFYNQNSMGMGYRNQNAPVPKMTQVLTQEQIAELKKNAVAFSLNPDPKEVLRAKCTHRDNGNFSLIENADNTMTCSICGKTFPMIEDVETATEITEGFIALLQSIKTYFLDMPENYVEDFFRIIPVVEKMPTLFEISQKNFYRYNNTNNDMLQQRGAYSFGMFDAIGSGYGYGQPGFGAPQGGMFGGMPQGGMYGAPQGGMFGGMPQGQFNNGGYIDPNFAAQQAAYQQQQQNTYNQGQANPLTSDGGTAPGYGYNPGAAVQANDTVQTTKQFMK